jgi:hypothetical protein
MPQQARARTPKMRRGPGDAQRPICDGASGLTCASQMNPCDVAWAGADPQLHLPPECAAYTTHLFFARCSVVAVCCQNHQDHHTKTIDFIFCGLLRLQIDSCAKVVRRDNAISLRIPIGWHSVNQPPGSVKHTALYGANLRDHATR